MTSYQLPDLLSLVASLAGNDDDGDLHISPFYDDGLRVSVLESLVTPKEAQRIIKLSRQQRTTEEFLHELNPTLLASVLVPFPSFPGSEDQPGLILRHASEWLAMCAITSEQILRPGRLVDFGLVAGSLVPSIMGGDGSLWNAANTLMQRRSCSSEEYRSLSEAFLKSITNVPRRPEHASIKVPSAYVEEYVQWRAKISGHALLFEIFFSSVKERNHFSHCLSTVLELNACVTDLFAYNIHQAWHSKSNGNSSHLNLISFLMAADPEMTLEGAINYAGGLIRKRFTQLRAQLDATKSQQTAPRIPSGPISSLATALLPSFASLKSEDLSGRTAKSVTSENDLEIRKVLLNWVAGVINWAYEVEYFHPNVDGDDHSQSSGKKKRGGEVRDYGWVFLIKDESASRPNGN